MAKQQLAGCVGNSALLVFNNNELKDIALTDNRNKPIKQYARLLVLLPYVKLPRYRAVGHQYT